MKKLTVIATLCLSAFAVHADGPPTITDVYNLLNQRLPADNQYSGRDAQGADCTLIVERFAGGEIRVNIMPAWGGFGIFNDGSQKLDSFKQSSNNAIQVKIETSASASGLTETSYGILNITPQAGSTVEYSEGLATDLLKSNPHMVSCKVSLQ